MKLNSWSKIHTNIFEAASLKHSVKMDSLVCELSVSMNIPLKDFLENPKKVTADYLSALKELALHNISERMKQTKRVNK